MNKSNQYITIVFILLVFGCLLINSFFLSNSKEYSGDEEVWSRNAQGETYGRNEYAILQTPDLIYAVNSFGLAGYVKAKDLSNNVATPEEALKYMKSDEYLYEKRIPLYKSDGITVIGDFEISTADYKIIFE